MSNKLAIMLFFGKNIRKIRSVKKLSQTAFADLFGMTRASIGAYEEGRSEPKISKVVEIANYFDIPIEHLLTKELSVNELSHFDIFKQNLATNSNNEEIEPMNGRNFEKTPYFKIIIDLEERVKVLEKLVDMNKSN